MEVLTEISLSTQFMQSLDYFGSLILILGSFLAFFLSIAIAIIKSSDSRANRWISLFCFFTAIFLMRGYLLISGYFKNMPLITLLIDNVRYVMGPCILFYVKTVIEPKFAIKKNDIYHILPLLINILLMLHVYSMPSVSISSYIENWFAISVLDHQYLTDSLLRLFFFTTFGIYIFVSFRLIYNSNIDFPKSAPGKKICFKWLGRLTASLVVILLIWAVCAVMIVVGFQKKYLYFAVYFAVSLATFICGLVALMHPEIFYRTKQLSPNSSLKNSRDYNQYLKRITHVMEIEQEYLNSELSLVSMAKKINISRTHLSRIINETYEHNFTDFVNFYRVQKVCQLMATPNQNKQSILEMAFHAGFNSKTTFNKAFKKFTGEVPSTYRKKVLTSVDKNNTSEL